ncbi:MAG: endonuclease NucS [Bryobacterales bacterium]|nr:endonuclease NucS [bacterium]MDE0434691.1 endonuclease NucS [Bryobacterales bacterium]
MNRHGFKGWLEQRDLKKASVATYLGDAKRVEKHCGDLDQLYTENRLDEAEINSLVEEIPDVAPKNLSSYRSAARRYREYREQTDTDGQGEDDGPGRIIGLERDLQAALRDGIEQLESGLHVTDGGNERSVASGRIDITAKDRDGQVVVIELKAGTARRKAIGQILSYMGDVADEESTEVRGILVAGEFDDKARAAARVVPALSLRRYRVKFEFSPPGDTASPAAPDL